MPKSKRAKVVHLSKTDKKGKELSQKLFANVQEAADAYSYIFVFEVDNMRNSYLKEVRAELADSRMFFGKTKVMAKALGLTPAEEHLPGLSALTAHLAGSVGLIFTNRDPESISSFFSAYARTDFARAGVRATHAFTVPAGTVYSRGGELAPEDDVPLPHSLEVTLRKWGMPVRLEKGKVVLGEEYRVCKEGEVLASFQTALLKLFGVAMAEFRVGIKAYYDKESGEVEQVEGEGMEE